MPTDLTYVFAPIDTKAVRKTADGRMLVPGKITGPDLDLDLQRMDPGWLKTAVPAWFEIGNLREMHQPKAVGKAVELAQSGDDWSIVGKVVDAGAIDKVTEEIYTGYSIGIKGARLSKSEDAPNGTIVGGTIVEVSLVDRPCNETAKFMLAKSAGPTGELVQVEEVAAPGLNEQEALVAETPQVEADDAATVPVVDSADAVLAAIEELAATLKKPAVDPDVPEVDKVDADDLVGAAKAALAGKVADLTARLDVATKAASFTDAEWVAYLADEETVKATKTQAKLEKKAATKAAKVDKKKAAVDGDVIDFLGKAADPDFIAALVKSLGIEDLKATASAVESLIEERLVPLEDQMKTVMETAIPGGPTLIGSGLSPTVAADEVAVLMSKASMAHDAGDRVLSESYRLQAEKLSA